MILNLTIPFDEPAQIVGSYTPGRRGCRIGQWDDLTPDEPEEATILQSSRPLSALEQDSAIHTILEEAHLLCYYDS